MDALFQAGSVIVWEDFERIVARIRLGGRPHFCSYVSRDGLGQLVEQEAHEGAWRVDHAAQDSPPISKKVGRRLAQAANGMLVAKGWDQALQDPQCALRQPRRDCLRLKPQLLPDDWKCTVSGTSYQHLMLGDFSNPEFPDIQPMKIAAHRLMCWLARGQPLPNIECLHSCNKE